jgi:hypothetical protein
VKLDGFFDPDFEAEIAGEFESVPPSLSVSRVREPGLSSD